MNPSRLGETVILIQGKLDLKQSAAPDGKSVFNQGAYKQLHIITIPWQAVCLH